jgi:hypothetical protein
LSPLARERPTCRIQEPARAASRGDPIEGELPHPRSLANGTEPHLANPHKRFHGRVSGSRANPYQTGHGRPLESPNNSSTRNPQSRDPTDGGCGNLTLRPAEGRRGSVQHTSESSPRSPRTGQSRGLDARLHLLGCTERRQHQSCACGTPRPAGTLPMPVETNTLHAVRSREKNPEGALTLLQGFGG